MSGGIWLAEVLFPPKCILCRRILQQQELDLCRNCRDDGYAYPYGRDNPEPEKFYHPQFLDSLTAVWYYEGEVRGSIKRYKFGRRPNMAESYGRLLGMKLLKQNYEDMDIVTWVPVFITRKLSRGFDQSELLARALGRELNLQTHRVIRKIRHTSTQSGIHDAAVRKANVMGAYRVIAPELVRNKRILLVDDVHTTGSTIEECAKILKLAGAKEVHGAAIAVAHKR